MPHLGLPLELVSEVLQESILDKRDLRIVALVSKAFLVLARPHLFHTVSIETAYCVDESDPARSYHWRTRRKLAFFRSRPDLARLVRHVSRDDCEDYFRPGDRAYPVIEPNALWDQILETFPQVESVYDHFSPTPSPHRVPECTKTIQSVADVWINKSSWEWLSRCAKLRSLRCSFGSDEPIALPAPLPFQLDEIRLETLYGSPKPFLDLVDRSSATLRSLDLCGRLAIMTDFSHLPHLEKLTLSVCGGQGKADPAREQSLVRASLPSLTRLRHLVIRQHFSWKRKGGVFEVIAHPDVVRLLPKTLVRIDAMDTPTVAQCKALFGAGTSVRVLGTQDWFFSAEVRVCATSDGRLRCQKPDILCPCTGDGRHGRIEGVVPGSGDSVRCRSGHMIPATLQGASLLCAFYYMPGDGCI